MNELKSCPLCGGTPFIDSFKEAQSYEPDMYYAGEQVRCKCGLSIQKYNTNDRGETVWTEYRKEIILQVREELINKWNRRV